MVSPEIELSENCFDSLLQLFFTAEMKRREGLEKNKSKK